MRVMDTHVEDTHWSSDVEMLVLDLAEAEGTICCFNFQFWVATLLEFLPDWFLLPYSDSPGSDFINGHNKNRQGKGCPMCVVSHSCNCQNCVTNWCIAIRFILPSQCLVTLPMGLMFLTPRLSRPIENIYSKRQQGQGREEGRPPGCPLHLVAQDPDVCLFPPTEDSAIGQGP